MSNQEKINTLKKLVQEELQYICEQEKNMIPYNEWKLLRYQEEYLSRLQSIIQGSIKCEKIVH